MIATETSVTDIYATRLLARVYGALAQAATLTWSPPWPAPAARSRPSWKPPPTGGTSELAGLGEWAAVTVLAAIWVGAGPGPGRDGRSGGAAVTAADRRAWPRGRTGTSWGGGPSSAAGPPT